MESSPVENLRDPSPVDARRLLTSGAVPSALLDCKGGEVCHRSPAATPLASTPLTPLLHPNSSQQTEMKNSTLVVSPLVASADSTTPVLVLSPPNNRLVLSPASQAPANTPTCAKAATRLRDGKLEQGVLREAASRLQQKIQKHLLDSEDLKEQAFDEEKSQKLLHAVDSKEELVLLMEKKSGVLGKGDSCIDLGQGGEPEKQLRSVRSAVACSGEDSGAEVVPTAADFVMTRAGEERSNCQIDQMSTNDE